MASALVAAASIPFPVDLDVGRRELLVADVAVEAIERAAFLDSRFDFDPSTSVREPLDLTATVGGPVHWLFHTSFCCSTLLSRMVERAGSRVVLREPLVLRRLADARAGGGATTALLPSVVERLAAPWRGHRDVVIKPTHAALNLAAGLLDARPDAKGVVISSSLRDFLVSNIKKTPETQAKVGALVDRALRSGSFRHRVDSGKLRPPDWLSLVGLQWAAQRELIVDAWLQRPDSLMAVDSDQLLEEPVGVVATCLDWWGLAFDREALPGHVGSVRSVHAKAPSRPYDGSARHAEARLVAEAYAGQLEAALSWLEAHVLPLMRAEAVSFARLGAPARGHPA